MEKWLNYLRFILYLSDEYYSGSTFEVNMVNNVTFDTGKLNWDELVGLQRISFLILNL